MPTTKPIQGLTTLHPNAPSSPTEHETNHVAADVQPLRGYYLVRLRQSATPSQVMVTKDKRCRGCRCDPRAREDCPAIQAVAHYLQAGGARAAAVPAKFLIPQTCPVCGGLVRHEPRLCSRYRGSGWVCLRLAEQEGRKERWQPSAGAGHYWEWWSAEWLRRLAGVSR
jgi:hypothetical protein